MAYILQEDGASKLVLEDGSGDLLQDFPTETGPSFIASVTTVYAPQIYFTGQQTVVTTPGTYQWLCPPGVTLVYVECTGGGGGGGGGTTFSVGGGGGAGAGAYSARVAVPVTPGTVYTFVVGDGGAGSAPNSPKTQGVSGGSSTFTGDAGVQVIAVGGSGGLGANREPGGAAASCTGDTGLKFSGGNGGLDGGGADGGGGAAAGNRLANGADGGDAPLGAFGTGGTGANGGGSGGHGGNPNVDNAQAGSAPGGGGGGGGTNEPGKAGAAGSVTITAFAVPFIASATVVNSPALVAQLPAPFIASVTAVYTPTFVPQLALPFIASVTAVYTPALVGQVDVPFIASTTSVYTPTLVGIETLPFIASVSVVYTPTLVATATDVDVPFIASRTHVWSLFSLFDPDRTFGGPGNGGETYLIRLAPNGTSETATLAADITATARAVELTGDSGLPTDTPFVATIDSEVVYLMRTAPGSYQIRLRALSNTVAASHTAGASVTWGDTYDVAIAAGFDIAHSFTADINSTGIFTYPAWLICFDSSQAYLAGDRYPMHVTEMLGVFDSGAGSSGSNRCDGAQPNAVCTPAGVSDDCPAALSNPARIATDILAGDVAVVRYTNPEATALDLGPRSVALQSWFGLKRVDDTDTDVTFTDPSPPDSGGHGAHVVDTIPGSGPYTGSVNDEWDPAPDATGIAPDASDAAGVAIPTPNPVPWTTVTLPGSDRYFTRGSGAGGYDEEGWPMCCLAVRQGSRRVPYWRSWDWKDYSYVYTGFGTDANFCQLLINRNGVLFDSIPSIELPGPQDLDGPDAVWDDGSYAFAASWYVVLFNGPYIVFGPGIGGTVTIVAGPGGDITGYAPGVTFPGGPAGPPSISVPPEIEGGSGGNIGQPPVGLHVWQTS